MSPNCRDFISKLLDKKPDTRLGSKGGVDEVMSHPWLSDINVNKLLTKDLEPPMKPTNVEALIEKLIQAKEGTGPEISIVPENKMNKVKGSVDKFAGFDMKKKKNIEG